MFHESPLKATSVIRRKTNRARLRRSAILGRDALANATLRIRNNIGVSATKLCFPHLLQLEIFLAHTITTSARLHDTGPTVGAYDLHAWPKLIRIILPYTPALLSLNEESKARRPGRVRPKAELDRTLRALGRPARPHARPGYPPRHEKEPIKNLPIHFTVVLEV